MIRVFVMDDHPIVRQGLVGILDDEADITVVGASDGSTVPTDVDVLLLDLEMPHVDGLTVIQQLASSPVRIVVFTAYGDDDRVIGALQAGARGYLLKGASSDEILHAIRTVFEGGSYLEPRIANRVLSQLRTPTERTTLTPREHEVLLAICQGQATKNIATELGISERTVKFHINSLFNKLEARNRAEAVAKAIELKLVRPVRKDRSGP